MDSSDSYTVQAFARLAGVSIRTLHYYDQVGLLRPDRQAHNGYRRYRRRDLLRLQQILTLKYLGFSLEEIRALLDDTRYQVGRSLQIQKDAIDQRIRDLQRVSLALSVTLAQISSKPPGDLDWQQVCKIIEGVTMDDKNQWQRKYYSPEAWEKIQERAKNYTPEQAARDQQAWAELIAEFQQQKNLGKSVSDPEVQKLAGRYAGLIQAFTQGDAQVLQGLNQMYKDMHNIPQEYRQNDGDLQQFMGKAYEIYHSSHSS